MHQERVFNCIIIIIIVVVVVVVVIIIIIIFIFIIIIYVFFSIMIILMYLFLLLQAPSLHVLRAARVLARQCCRHAPVSRSYRRAYGRA